MQSLLLRRDDELDAAVVLAPLRRCGCRRSAASVRSRAPPCASDADALPDEERAHRLGALLRQLHVVLERAARVGVAFDAHLDLGPRL